MKVLITGATGLIGVHCLHALLTQGIEAHVLVRNRDKLNAVLEPFGRSADACRVTEGSLEDAETLRRAMAPCDAVIHAAGVFSNRREDRALMEATNIEGTRRVLGLACELGLDPVIHLSSILALFPPPGSRQSADDPVQTPRSVYAATKAGAERVAREFQARGAPVVCVYPGAVQGPSDPSFGDGPQLIARYLKTGSVLVTEGGLVYTDVRDLAQAILAMLEPGRGPRRYMFGGNYLSHEALRQLLSRLTGRELRAQRVPAWLLRAMGRLGDLYTGLSGKPTQLTYEAALVLTASVPCDDQPTIDALGLTPMTAEASFRDLIVWMNQSGRLSDEKTGALADPA